MFDSNTLHQLIDLNNVKVDDSEKSLFGKISGTVKNISSLVQAEYYLYTPPISPKVVSSILTKLDMKYTDEIILVCSNDRVGNNDSYCVLDKQHLIIVSNLDLNESKKENLSIKIPLAAIHDICLDGDKIQLRFQNHIQSITFAADHIYDKCADSKRAKLKLIVKLIKEIKLDAQYSSKEEEILFSRSEQLAKLSNDVKNQLFTSYFFNNNAVLKSLINTKSTNDPIFGAFEIDKNTFVYNPFRHFIFSSLNNTINQQFKMLMDTYSFQEAHLLQNWLKGFEMDNSSHPQNETAYNKSLNLNFDKIEKRQILLTTKESPKKVLNNSFPIHIDSIPSFLKFPPTHPKAGEIYIAHPIENNYYLPIESHDDYLFEQKTNEFIKLLSALGAKSINYSINQISNSQSNTESKQNGKSSIGIGNIGAKKSLESQNDSNESKNESFSQSYELTYAPTKKPYIPEGMYWFEHEPEWKRLAEDRIESNLLSSNTQFSKSQAQLTDTRTLQNIEAELSPASLPIGASLKLAKEKFQKSKTEFQITINVKCEFESVINLS